MITNSDRIPNIKQVSVLNEVHSFNCYYKPILDEK